MIGRVCGIKNRLCYPNPRPQRRFCPPCAAWRSRREDGAIVFRAALADLAVGCRLAASQYLSELLQCRRRLARRLTDALHGPICRRQSYPCSRSACKAFAFSRKVSHRQCRTTLLDHLPMVLSAVETVSGRSSWLFSPLCCLVVLLLKSLLVPRDLECGSLKRVAVPEQLNHSMRLGSQALVRA